MYYKPVTIFDIKYFNILRISMTKKCFVEEHGRCWDLSSLSEAYSYEVKPIFIISNENKVMNKW